MLHSESETSANRSITRFVAAAIAMAVLAGCAIAVPLRPLATSLQNSRDRDLACRAGSKCSNATTDDRVAYHRSRPVRSDKIDDDPPNFIRDQHGTPPLRTQSE